MTNQMSGSTNVRRIYFLLLKIIAAITPGTQPTQVKSRVSIIAPHPQSKTANGGKIIHNIALPHPILQSPMGKVYSIY